MSKFWVKLWEWVFGDRGRENLLVRKKLVSEGLVRFFMNYINGC